ncbi:Uncharacterized protein DAT39_008804, partial [Clarias magur]
MSQCDEAIKEILNVSYLTLLSVRYSALIISDNRVMYRHHSLCPVKRSIPLKLNIVPQWTTFNDK